MSEPEYVDPSQLRPGPIRNESLPPELFRQIKAVFDVISPYIGMTLEQFEVGFMRDMHPEREVDVWCSITAAWLDYRTLFRARLHETSSISPVRRALETEFPKSRFRN